MDTGTLVDKQIEAGQGFLGRLAEEGFSVVAAFWGKPTDEGRWSLYVVTPVVDEVGTTEAFRRTLPAVRALGGTWINESSLNLLSPASPLARGALALRARFPDRMPNRYGFDALSSLQLEDVYVYPRSTVEVPLYGMVFRGEAGAGALHLSFEPHNPTTKLTVESGGCQRNTPPRPASIIWLSHLKEPGWRRTPTGLRCSVGTCMDGGRSPAPTRCGAWQSSACTGFAFDTNLHDGAIAVAGEFVQTPRGEHLP
jgi:hypothetical protein